jgi:hypothetical protein
MGMKKIINWKLFWIIFGAGLFGVVASLPYVLELQRETLELVPLPLPVLLIISVVQGGVLVAIAAFIGLVLAPKVGLGAPLLEKKLKGEAVTTNIKKYIGVAALFGVLTTVLIVIGDLMFKALGLEVAADVQSPIWWKGLLAAFYGGITEEILLRLFVVTLLVWILSKLLKNRLNNVKMWFAIILAAILFGVGHLPTASAAGMDMTLLLTLRIILLNAVGGIIFGWLYWKKGFEAAVIAHFTADICLHVVIATIMS